LVFLFLPIFSISPASAAPVADTSLADIILAGEIVVGIEAGYPPFEQRNTTTDEIEGFDPDIMQYIADDIGVDIVWMDVDWAVIFTGLAAGNYDCVISAVTITETREETMDFSRWYYRSTQAVMVYADNPKGIVTVDDVNSTDVKIGIQEGTTSEWYIDDEGVLGDKVGFTAITLAIEALALGTVDVVLGDYATLAAGKETDPDNYFIIDTFSPEDFGIPVQSGFDTLRARINTLLDELLGDDVDSADPNQYYLDSFEEWFGEGGVEFALDEAPEAAGGIPGYSMVAFISIISVVSIMLIRKMKKRV
jgi:ABC-type amino acid transport substrate-binding protein